MKTAMATIVLVFMLATSMPVHADEPDQTGESLDCLDFLVLWAVPGVESPVASYVEVEPGAMASITSEDGAAYVDFFDADGNQLGFGEEGFEKVVPDDADYGIVCVWVADASPVGPATWIYSESG